MGFFLELLHLVESLPRELVQLALSLFLTGAALILATLISHGLIDAFKARSQRRRHVSRHLMPALSVADELVSRLTEILVWQKSSMLESVAEYDRGTALERMRNLRPDEMTRIESTAYRLIHFLATAALFRRATLDTPRFGMLDRATFFLRHKIPVALRGLVYDLNSGISTETQDALGTEFFDHDRTRTALDLSPGLFCRYLRSGEYPKELYLTAQAFFAVDTRPLTEDAVVDPRSPDWRRIIGLVGLTIYLVDFVASLAQSPQWEERRVYLVKLIKEWNKLAPRRVYLYAERDVDAESFVGTYPGRATSRNPLLALIDLVPEKWAVRRHAGRAYRRGAAWWRGRRFTHRHAAKKICDAGVKVRLGDGTWKLFSWHKDLKEVHAEIKAFLGVRLTN